MPKETEIRLRLALAAPAAGNFYALNDRKNALIDPRLSDGSPMTFEVPARLTDEGRFLGEYVRSEGKERQFVYVVVRTPDGPNSGRMKIDLHPMPDAVKDAARAGRTLEIGLSGKGLATIKPLEASKPV